VLVLSESRIHGTILRLAWPAIVESLLQLLVYLVGSIMVGPLGTTAFAAVGQASMLATYLLFPFWSIGTASAALVSRHIGGQDMVSARACAAQGMLLALVFGVFFTIVGICWSHEILLLIGTEPEVAALGAQYLEILLGFSLFQSLRVVGSSILRSVGDTRTPMWATGVMNLVNLAACYVFVYGWGPFPRLEVAGVALASGLSFVVSLYIVLRKMGNRHEDFFLPLRDLFRPAVPEFFATLRLAAPNMAEMVLQRAGGLTYLWVVTGLGTTALAAHYMAVRVESIAFMPAFGLSMAVPPLVGQALGAMNPNLADLAVRRTVMMGFWSMNLLAVGFLAVPGLLVGMFSPEPEVYKLSSLVVQISAFELTCVTLYMIYGSAMRGAGDTVSPMIVTFIGAILVRIGLVYTLAVTLDLGLPGVWIGTVVHWALRALAAYLLFRRGRWRTVRV